MERTDAMTGEWEGWGVRTKDRGTEREIEGLDSFTAIGRKRILCLLLVSATALTFPDTYAEHGMESGTYQSAV